MSTYSTIVVGYGFLIPSYLVKNIRKRLYKHLKKYLATTILPTCKEEENEKKNEIETLKEQNDAEEKKIFKKENNWLLFYDEYREMYEIPYVFLVHADAMLHEYENTRGGGGYGFHLDDFPKITPEIIEDGTRLYEELQKHFENVQRPSLCVYHCLS